MDERVLELINKEIDGINTPVEQRELKAVLATDGDSKILYDDLAGTVRLLQQVEMHEPPPDLKQAIMSALPADRYAPSRSPALLAWLRSLGRAWQAAPRLAFAYVAVGLVAGVSLYAVWDNVPQDASNAAYGTLVSGQAPADLQAVEDFSFDAADAHGTVRLQTGDRVALVEIDVDARDPVEIQLAFDDESLLLSGLRRTGARGGMLRAEKGLVALGAQGRQAFVLEFEHQTTEQQTMDEGSFEVRVVRDGSLQYRRTLQRRGQ